MMTDEQLGQANQVIDRLLKALDENQRIIDELFTLIEVYRQQLVKELENVERY